VSSNVCDEIIFIICLSSPVSSSYLFDCLIICLLLLLCRPFIKKQKCEMQGTLSVEVSRGQSSEVQENVSEGNILSDLNLLLYHYMLHYCDVR